MAVLTILVALVFSVTFLDMPRLGAGWFWDFANALGFLAFAGLLFQMIPYPRSTAAKRHERLGYWVLAIAIVHAFLFLTGDPVVHVYLQPGAPVYMWLGLGGLVLIALLTVLARMPDRMRVHRRYAVFRTVHRAMGLAAVVAAGLHIIISGFYLSSWLQVVLFALLTVAACFGKRLWAGLKQPPSASSRLYLLAGTVAVGVFLLVRDVWA